jgi:GntR family transcriptional regulator/MocR family aminotransferase
MDRPDAEVIKDIYLNRESGVPIYQQLVDAIAKCIQLGSFKNGEQLPSTRMLAKTLGLNRNTVLKAIEELEASGWIKVYPKKACIISTENANRKVSSMEVSSFPQKSNFPFERSNLISWPHENSPIDLGIHEGKLDETLVNAKLGAKYYVQSLKQKSTYSKGIDENQYFLKRFINYVKVTRNLSLKSEEILVTRSPEICLQLLSKVLLSPEAKLGICEWGNSKDNMLFQSHGIKLELISTDIEGMVVEDLNRKYSPSLKGIYLSSLHQFPTSVRLSERRKWELIEFAKKKNLFVLDSHLYEDYYYTLRPEAGLKEYLGEGNVLILGELGAELGEVFKIGYLVGPPDVITELKKYQPLYEPSPDPYLLGALAKFMEEGELWGLVKKHRKRYKERRETMGNLFLSYFGAEVQLNLPKVGLGMWLNFKYPINLMELKRQCENLGLWIPLSCLYQTKDYHAIRIGFSDLDEPEIEKVVKIIFESYLKVKG